MLLAAISDTVERGFEEFFVWLPHLLAALAVLVIGYIVAKILGRIVARVLERAGFDGLLNKGQGGRFIEKVTSKPSSLLGTITFWVVMLGTISLAVAVLGIEALQNFVASVYAYLPNVIAAVLIFLVAGAIAAGVSTLVSRTMGDTALGKIVATAAPILVMTIATFMILDQLKIAETIVTITYAAVLGAVALGAALAFGLGGRDVARDMLQNAYDKGKETRDEYRRDLNVGVSRSGRTSGDVADTEVVVPPGASVSGYVGTDASTRTDGTDDRP